MWDHRPGHRDPQAPLGGGWCPWSLRKEPACPQPDVSPRLAHSRPPTPNTATEYIRGAGATVSVLFVQLPRDTRPHACPVSR